MTDNEIIKALEYCYGHNAGDAPCGDCPRFNHPDGCVHARDAIDIINRQKAEISELQHRNSELEIELKAMRGAANSYKAEVERLEGNLKFVRGTVERMKKYDEERDIRLHARLTETARAEAIKEFAQDLKEALYFTEFGTPVVDVSDIDDFVKEMVGDDNAKT